MQELELAAKRTLMRLAGCGDVLKPLYVQPDRAIFLAENVGIILKVYMQGQTLQHEYAIAQTVASIGVPTPKILGFEAGQPSVLALTYIDGRPLSSLNTSAAKEAGKHLQNLHAIGAQPPFAGGQQRWDEFIFWWSNEELEKVKRLNLFEHKQILALQTYFDTVQPLLVRRPIVLLHGDLQPVHILIDPQSERVLAFLDFADAQAGDPLLDIAIVSLWDQELADFILMGYDTLDNNQATQRLLTFYRLLRKLSEIPWLLARGFNEMAARDIMALHDFLKT